MKEQLPGIYEIPLTSVGMIGVSAINIYVVKGHPGQRNLMIDCGFCEKESHDQLYSALSSLGISPAQTDIFITHEHTDHCGLAGLFQKQGARIFMNPAEDRHSYNCLYHHNSQSAYAEQDGVLKSLGITEDLCPGLYSYYMRSRREAADKYQAWVVDDFTYIPVRPHQVFFCGPYSFEAIPLKGHTFGQLGLFDSSHRLVFAADQILNNIVPNTSTTYMDDGLLQGLFDSLAEFSGKYSDCDIFPAHDGKILDVQYSVRHIINSYLHKLGIIEDVLEKADCPLTIKDVAYMAYSIKKDPENDMEFVLTKSMISKTFACLEYLLQRKAAIRTVTDGVILWEKA